MNVRRLQLLGFAMALALVLFVSAASAQVARTTTPPPQDTYTFQEIVDAGHGFFGKMAGGLAEAVESVFREKGRPNAYIVGEEAAGSFIGGLRYGEGVIFMKAGGRRKIFWQGPTVGFDFGGNGSRVMVLIYNLPSIDHVYRRIPGVEGSAYLVGGFGINYQQQGNLLLAPIRTGIGARLGINIGYLKYTPQPTWNPF